VSPTVKPSFGPSAKPTFFPSEAPTPCEQVCFDLLDAALAEIAQLQNRTTSSDECYDSDIDTVKLNLDSLTSDVAGLETCNTVTDQATKLVELEQVLDNFLDIQQLQQNNKTKWQAAVTDFDIPCSYVPFEYCDLTRQSGGICFQGGDGVTCEQL